MMKNEDYLLWIGIDTHTHTPSWIFMRLFMEIIFYSHIYRTRYKMYVAPLHHNGTLPWLYTYSARLTRANNTN